MSVYVNPAIQTLNEIIFLIIESTLNLQKPAFIAKVYVYTLHIL